MTYSETEKMSIVYLTKSRSASVSLLKKCPHVQKMMPTFQCNWHASHISGSVSNNSDNSMLPAGTAHSSQENDVTLDFGSPCSPRSAFIVHDLICRDQKRVSPFLSRNGRFQEKNVFENYLAHFQCLSHQRISSFSHMHVQNLNYFCLQMNVLKHQLPENETLFFHLAQWSRDAW